MGRLWNRGEERPRSVDAAVGVGERTRRSCEIIWEFVVVVCVEVDIEGVVGED